MLDKLWQEFQQETQQYKESTEERKLRFEALKKKDEDSARTISRQMRKLQKLHVCVCMRACSCPFPSFYHRFCQLQYVGSNKAVMEVWEQRYVLMPLLSLNLTLIYRNHTTFSLPRPQDTISHLKQKMAANTRENDEKMSTIKEASKLILTKKCFSNARNESCFSDGFTAGSGSHANPLS